LLCTQEVHESVDLTFDVDGGGDDYHTVFTQDDVPSEELTAPYKVSPLVPIRTPAAHHRCNVC
jgi:hypothetical protein